MVGQGDFGPARPNPFQRLLRRLWFSVTPTENFIVFCETGLAFWETRPDRKLEVKIVIVFLWSLRLYITGQC